MKKITLAFGVVSLLLCSIFTVCQGYDAEHPFNKPTIPTTSSSDGVFAQQNQPPQPPDKKLLDKDPEQFFKEFGKYAVTKMKGASDLQKARRVILEVGNLAKEYNLYANVNLRGRTLDILNQKGNCGYWREHLKEAFKGAGIPKKKIISVESYEYEVPGGVEDYGFLLGNLWKNLDVNHLHTSIAFVDDDGKIYTFDVWQYGADHAFIGGRPSLRQKDHVGVSKYNAMPLSEWIEIQKKAGRNVIGSDEMLLENSRLYQNFIRDTLRLIMEKEKKGELEIKSGRSKDITALIKKMASFLIIDKSRVDPEEMIKVIAKKGLVKELELVKKWHDLDGLKICEEYTVYRRDGHPIEHGTYKAWYESGQKLTQGEFKDGEQCGTWTQWFENGQMSSQGKYKDGKECGTWTYWASDGEVSDKTNYGPCP